MKCIQFRALNSDSPYNLFCRYSSIELIRYLYIQLDSKWANLCSEHMDTQSDKITDGLLMLQTCFLFLARSVYRLRTIAH